MKPTVIVLSTENKTTNTPIDSTGAYIEMRNMAAFLLNVVIGDLIDHPQLKTQSQQEVLSSILDSTHAMLHQPPLLTLAEHNQALNLLQDGANQYSTVMGAPLTEFVYFDENINNQRFGMDTLEDDSCNR